MSSRGDQYEEWDGAYVLGALSVAERHEFEEHLRTCPACREAVAELAAMPGLLAQVPAAEATAGSAPDAAPLPSDLVLAVRRRDRQRRGRRWLVAAVAAVALVLGGLGGYGLRAVWGPGTVPGKGQSYRLAFSPVAPSSMTAVVDVVAVPTGTEFRVECQYGTSNSAWPAGGEAEYSIVVIDTAGHAVQAKTWTVRPQRVMHPVAPSPLPPSRVAAVEIRETATGKALLRAALR